MYVNANTAETEVGNEIDTYTHTWNIIHTHEIEDIACKFIFWDFFLSSSSVGFMPFEYQITSIITVSPIW